MRSAGLKRRVPAAFLAALWIATPVASALHGAGAGHRYCLEHHAFEEESGVGGAPAAARDEAASRLLAAPAAERAVRHEACVFVQSGVHRGAGHGPRLATAQLPAARRAVSLPPRPIDTSSIPLLAQAPKSSPPSA